MSWSDLQRPAKPVFMERAAITGALKAMEADRLLNTAPVLVKDESNAVQVISFSEKHLSYLMEHPKVNPKNYLTNLRTMIKIRH